MEGWGDEAEGSGGHWVGITHGGSVRCLLLRPVPPTGPGPSPRPGTRAQRRPRCWPAPHRCMPCGTRCCQPREHRSNPHSTPAQRATPTLGRGSRSASSWQRGGGAAGCTSCSKRPNPGVRPLGSPAGEAAEALPHPPPTFQPRPPPRPPPPPRPGERGNEAGGDTDPPPRRRVCATPRGPAATAMRQRKLGSHTPPCHRPMVITTLFNVLLAALQRRPVLYHTSGDGARRPSPPLPPAPPHPPPPPASPPNPRHDGEPAPPPARGGGWGRAACMAADMQSCRDSHRAPPGRPVSLKIGLQIKSNQIKSPLPPPPTPPTSPPTSPTTPPYPPPTPPLPPQPPPTSKVGGGRLRAIYASPLSILLGLLCSSCMGPNTLFLAPCFTTCVEPDVLNPRKIVEDETLFALY